MVASPFFAAIIARAIQAGDPAFPAPSLWRLGIDDIVRSPRPDEDS